MAAQLATPMKYPYEVGDTLETVERAITREGINAYRAASGDHNPLHFDDEFAAATQFGGVIAHGMLTLALVSEMMTRAYGADWLSTGNLRVRFRGAAYPGDVLKATGSVAKRESTDNGVLVTCNVEVRGAHNDNRIITGSASVRLDPPTGGDAGE
jgi:3-hydroxybutyryl-CoA dehydratase